MTIFWLWFVCLLIVIVRGIVAHATCFWQADDQTHGGIPGHVVISVILADLVLPVAVLFASLAFAPWWQWIAGPC